MNVQLFGKRMTYAAEAGYAAFPINLSKPRVTVERIARMVVPGRDLAGVRKVVLDAAQKAQGQGCAPGILGVAIGGDRGSSYYASKEVLFRKMDEHSPDPKLAELEDRLTVEANQLGIGPMGFGGETTVLGVKATGMYRLPASFFVSVSYMCWANRRRRMIVRGEEVVYQ